MNRTCWNPIVAFAALTAIALPLRASVSLEQRGDAVVVSIGQQPFAVYDTRATHHRPYFRDVRGADGTLLSRLISPPGGDHPHHTGIWIAVDKVNGTAFWGKQGSIKNLSVDVVKTDANPAIMCVRNEWSLPSGEVVLPCARLWLVQHQSLRRKRLHAGRATCGTSDDFFE